MRSSSDTEKTDSTVVILGCRVLPGGTPSPALERRLARGLGLFEAGLGNRVVVAGGRTWSGVSEAACMRDWLVRRGVPPERIVLEDRSRDTLENARNCSALLGRREQLALVTCDWHMPRARACFAWVGLDAVPFEASSPTVHWSARVRRSVVERIARPVAFVRHVQQRWRVGERPPRRAGGHE